jgi:hypothetical protein
METLIIRASNYLEIKMLKLFLQFGLHLYNLEAMMPPLVGKQKQYLVQPHATQELPSLK